MRTEYRNTPMSCIRCRWSVVRGPHVGSFKMTQLGPRHANPEKQCPMQRVETVPDAE